MRILAIDPGFERVGIAVLEKIDGGKETLIYSGCFKTKKLFHFSKRLNLIGQEVEMVVKKYKPKVLAIEKLYLNTNQKTVMGVAEARGVILYVASMSGLDIFEYSPPQIKLAVTGYGRATKDMVIRMIPRLIKVGGGVSSDDELDAIAVGLTCFACERFK